MQFKVPNAPQVHIATLGNFLGVDFTSALPNIRRASGMLNVINKNGEFITRPGYAQVGNTFEVLTHNAYVAETTYNASDVVSYQGKDYTCILESTGNAPTNATYWEELNVVSDMTQLKINGVWNMDTTTNVFIVHAGSNLYLSDVTFTSFTLLKSGLTDAISQGIILDNKLYIFDGNRAIVYHNSNGWKAQYVDETGDIPITSISRAPDGTDAVVYQDINLIQPYRYNHFLGDGASATFVLETPFDNEAPTGTILQENGTIANLTVSSFDKDAGTVTFTTIPPASPVDGRDNVYIKFKVTNQDGLDYINKSTIVTSYGYNGNNNRLFITGNPEYPNIDWFSEAESGTYFPAENFTKIGFEPIINYIRLNDGSLGIQKRLSDTDSTIYYRTSALYGGKEIFPISTGVKNIGCISKFANGNLLNDPLTLSDTGVYSITGSNYGEKFAQERSYFVRKKLLAETNLENAIAIVYQNNYYLAINNNVYVADSNYKSKIEGTSSSFQYEWYFWDNMPVRLWFVFDEELYFGTNDGKIVKLNTTNLDYSTPIESYVDTAYLDLESITQSKTAKRVTVISKPEVESNVVLSYITVDETTAIVTKAYEAETFPMVLQEKEKIKKFMFVKFRISNAINKKMSFYQMAIEYVYSGHYRGE